MYVADNGGHLLFIDYSQSGLVGSPSNFVSAPYLVARWTTWHRCQDWAQSRCWWR